MNKFRPRVDASLPAWFQKSFSRWVDDFFDFDLQYIFCGMANNFSHECLGWLNGWVWSWISLKPESDKNKYSWGKFQGIMCICDPLLILPIRHGNPGKKPRILNWSFALGCQVFGVVMSKVPFLLRWLWQVRKKSSGLPKCSIPSQQAITSYSGKLLGIPSSKLATMCFL